MSRLLALACALTALAAVTFAPLAPAHAQRVREGGGVAAVHWTGLPVYRGEADLYSFRPIFNPPYEVFPCFFCGQASPEFAFDKFTLIGDGGGTKKTTTQIGFTATVSILIGLLQPTEIRAIQLLCNEKTGFVIKTQEATVLDIHPGGANVQQDSVGHYLISGKKGDTFTMEATFDLPPFVLANLNQFESHFIIGLVDLNDPSGP